MTDKPKFESSPKEQVNISINGVLVGSYTEPIKIEIDGDVNYAKTNIALTISGNVGGDVNGTDVVCGDIGGDLHGTNIDCADVGGNVDGTNVDCCDITGNVNALNVSYRKRSG